MAASGRVWRWIVRPAGALVLGLLAVEASLQVAALFVRDSRRPAAFVSDRERVLFLGDSNTYGLWVKPTEAYPIVFEGAWNARHPERPVEVLNLAYPGTNSSALLRKLPKLLRAVRPDAVLILVGVNDFWTAPVATASRDSLGSRVQDALWRWSRSYRLFFMLRRRLAAPAQVDVPPPQGRFEHGGATVRYGDEPFEFSWHQRAKEEHPGGPEILAELARNLTQMAALARDAGVRLAFLTYPSESPQHFYAHADEQIRETARATRTPLVDLGFRFRFACPEGRCDLLLADQHPSAKGHELAGHDLAEEIGNLDVLSR